MTDVVLIVVTSLMFLFGWFLMKQLDFILDENQKRIKKASEQQQLNRVCILAKTFLLTSLRKCFPVFTAIMPM